MTLCHQDFTGLSRICLNLSKSCKALMHTLRESRQPPETQQFDLYHPVAPLPHSDTARFLPHILTTGLHLGSLPSTVCFSTRTRPFPIPAPSDWFRLFSSQTFSHINTPTTSFQLFFLLTPPMEIEQSVLKCRHIKFRCWGIAQK